MTVENSQQDGRKCEPQLCPACNHDAKSRTRFPLLHLKTARFELTLGPSWAGVMVGLAALDHSLAGVLLGLLGGAGIGLLGKWLFARSHWRS